jgi:PmbA protein
MRARSGDPSPGHSPAGEWGLRDVAVRAVETARRLGADRADAYIEVSRESQVRVREGDVEDLTQATARGIGLRLIKDGCLGFAYSSDVPGGDNADVDQLAARALALASATAPDPANVIPTAEDLLPRNGPLELCDPRVVELSTEWKIAAAKEMERAGRAFDRHVLHFESVGVSDVISEVAFASSEGIADGYRQSSVVLYSAPVAQGDDGSLQTSSFVDYRRFLDELRPAEEVGRLAAARAVRMLGAKKGPTARLPVVMEPQIAAGFFGGLLSALDGNLVRKGASFLRDKLGARIGPDWLRIIDDGLFPRGLGSAPFDGEGLPTRRTPLVEAGVLQAFLYDCTTAAKVGAQSTRTASRGYRSLPGIGTTTVLAQSARPTPHAKILEGIREGLFVTAMLGRGGDPVTGDYSRGANGLWIENGELTHPVQEMTVGGNLLAMSAAIEAMGDDLEFHGSLGAPTLRFGELTVSGA